MTCDKPERGKTGAEKLDIEKLLGAGQTIQLKPQGYSMYPLFVPGRDEARIAPIGDRRVKRGDVVLYRRDQSILVLHRIVRRDAAGIYLTGDNQKEIEGPLREDQMRGILIGFVRKGRYISVKNIVYRMYAGIWLYLRPFRPFISRTVAKIKRIRK